MSFSTHPSNTLGVTGGMGAWAAMLAITGIFGMAADSVSKRLRELGIRVALGAQPKQIVQAALGRAFKLLGFGSAAGLLLGLLATRVLSDIVYHATPSDPVVLAAVVAAYGSARPCGLVDSGAPRPVGESDDPAKGRVTSFHTQK
jgi:ABC-type antimicrobial peptide transport system permease subunit